ncbi:MAG: helix-turn-helix domain-containing protein [Gammaproteobacteria bacterium]|nr:helix-turn-helix domain-containing protein [Gammaproteobacteria bacterium]
MKIQEIIGTRIAEMRKKRGLTLKALSELSNGQLTSSCVANWERAARTPGPNEAILLGRLLNVAPSYLLGLTSSEDGAVSISPAVSGSPVPLLTAEQAIDPINNIKMLRKEHADIRYVSLNAALKNTQHKNCFALRIQDDSMSPRINAGDIVILNPDEQPKPGGLVAVKITNQPGVIIRQYKQRSINNAFETFELIAFNNNWASIVIDKLDAAKIVGVVFQSTHVYL